jgi:uncharacterized protein YecE (DUF72 family)
MNQNFDCQGIYIGTSGWMYDHWSSRFYPSELKSADLLTYYSNYFPTVEVNNTFYQLPDQDQVQNWIEQTPQNFIFSIKANRYITHMKNLKDAEEPLNKLFTALQPIKKKLRVILFQLPPHWHVNLNRLTQFVSLLPNDQRFVFEFRHPSWYQEEVIELLRNQNIALCLHDKRGDLCPEHWTASFGYFRFHGPRGEYQRKYSKSDLRQLVSRIKTWRNENRDLFVYFNNDAKAHAIENAQELQNMLNK